MAKLYFRYSTMNGGKSTALLQAAFNYEERGMKVLVLKPAVDSKGGDKVVSRLGMGRKADILVRPTDKVSALVGDSADLKCILIDEAQFLTPSQVDELFWIAVHRNIPVLAYGLRTDFSMTAFPGAARLLQLAHELQELKTICRCGKKAVVNGRKVNGSFVCQGDQLAIDGEHDVEYEALCGACYDKLVLHPDQAA
ncbi:thymidine kinase [soil metagenome]